MAEATLCRPDGRLEVDVVIRRSRRKLTGIVSDARKLFRGIGNRQRHAPARQQAGCRKLGG
jgi:hypothetical protein